MGRTDLDVQLGISDGIADLLKRTSCREHRKGRNKRDHTCRSSTCRNTEHVRFCDTAVKELVGMFLLELDGLCCFRKVRVKDDDIILVAEFREGGTVGFSCCNLFCHCDIPPRVLTAFRDKRSAQQHLVHILLRSVPCRASLLCFPYKKHPYPWWCSQESVSADP